ncbi:MAG: DNA translocase FtsK 4TM domain-containing protein, partial [Rhodobacterales bacterium]
SHSPNDPNFLNSTSGEIQNKMGFVGASYAGTLMLAIGWASWTFTLALLVWGIRLTLHKNNYLLLRRGAFLPVFSAFCAVFLATNVTPNSWPYSYSLGGFAGDAILEILLDLNPIDLTIWVKSISISLGILTILIGLFSLGFSLDEIKNILQRAGRGIFLILVTILKVLRKFTQIGSNRFKIYSPYKKEAYENLKSNGDQVLRPNITSSENIQPQKLKEKKIKALFTSIPI